MSWSHDESPEQFVQKMEYACGRIAFSALGMSAFAWWLFTRAIHTPPTRFSVSELPGWQQAIILGMGAMGLLSILMRSGFGNRRVWALHLFRLYACGTLVAGLCGSGAALLSALGSTLMPDFLQGRLLVSCSIISVVFVLVSISTLGKLAQPEVRGQFW